MLREQMPRKLMENEREEERHCDGRTGDECRKREMIVGFEYCY